MALVRVANVGRSFLFRNLLWKQNDSGDRKFGALGRSGSGQSFFGGRFGAVVRGGSNQVKHGAICFELVGLNMVVQDGKCNTQRARSCWTSGGRDPNLRLCQGGRERLWREREGVREGQRAPWGTL